jgi:hypothetical protein
MQRPEKKEPSTLAELIEETTYTPGSYKAPCSPPAIDPGLQLKWGLHLLGEDKAKEYLAWVAARLHRPQ